MLDDLGDKAAIVAVIDPREWSKAMKAVDFVLSELSPEMRRNFPANRKTPGDLIRSLTGPSGPRSDWIADWDQQRPIVLSLFDIGDGPGNICPRSVGMDELLKAPGLRGIRNRMSLIPPDMAHNSAFGIPCCSRQECGCSKDTC